MKRPSLHELRLFARYHLVRRVATEPVRDPDLGSVELPYESGQFEDDLRDAAGPAGVETLAELVYRGRSHPIFRVAFEAAPSAPRVLILSGVHGNERAGVLAVPPMLRRFRADSDLFGRVALSVMSPLNPVGVAEMSRFNVNGFDINRDFKHFETLEARLVRSEVERWRPEAILSLHEGPQDSTFMFTNAFVPRSLATQLLHAIAAGGSRLATRDYFGRTLNPPGYAPHTWALGIVETLWASTLGMRATGSWAESRGVAEITLETPWREKSLEGRARPHIHAALALCRALQKTAS